MVKDLKLDIEIVSAPIVRDRDGLALSSRNIRLSDEGRKNALIISKALREGKYDKERVISILNSEPNFTLDYVEIIDADTFKVANSQSVNKRTLIAGWVEGVRLLDNA